MLQIVKLKLEILEIKNNISFLVLRNLGIPETFIEIIIADK